MSSETAEQLTAARTSPLEETHRRLGASLVEREGALVPADYGDAAGEYESVRGGGAGVIDLSSRGRVRVEGGEAVMFLNGMVTNDVKALAEGSWVPCAFPNPQGRLIAHARVARLGDAFLIDTEPATREQVRKALERFTLAGDFRVQDLSEETAQLSVQGAGALATVGAVLGAEASEIERGRALETEWRGAPVTLLRATHTGEDGFDLFVEAARGAELWDALTDAGARPFGFGALEVLRVEAGVPRFGVDVTESNVVLEAGQTGAVSFTKGCYVGQEIIARIHWRGHVAKQLAGLVFEDEGAEPAAPGSKIFSAEGKEAGRVTSSVYSPRAGRAVALGIVKYDFLKPDTPLRVGVEAETARAARVSELPLVRGSWQTDERGGEPA
ncbi:MAG TPA: aminomethyltransferase family protein [Pyrinomonadaceae bacterium]|nr:aminomethyltransferase family protein [Pyrinomonadaceae bacterium]